MPPIPMEIHVGKVRSFCQGCSPTTLARDPKFDPRPEVEQLPTRPSVRGWLVGRSNREDLGGFFRMVCFPAGRNFNNSCVHIYTYICYMLYVYYIYIARGSTVMNL